VDFISLKWFTGVEYLQDELEYFINLPLMKRIMRENALATIKN